MSSGLSPRQLLERVVRPTLSALGDRYAGPAAEQLVMGTGAHESMGFSALAQFGGGPALGLFQMEPATQRSLHVDLLSKRKDDLEARVIAMIPKSQLLDDFGGIKVPSADELIWNLRYATAMCRIRYLWDPHPLPLPGDVVGLAETWKRSYNTIHGAGRPEDFIRAWHNHLAGIF